MVEQRDRQECGEVRNERCRLGLWAWLILMAYGSTLLGLWLGSTRVLTWHEAFSSEPAREMLITGNWILPHFGEVLTTHKPPLMNWLIALSMRVFDSRAEWVCRLPSVAAALLTAWLIAILGARWHGRRVGLVSGLIVLSSFYVLMQGRLAEVDMILCLAVTGAIVSFALLEEDPAPRGTRRLLLISCFFAFNALAVVGKYLIGPVFVGGGILLYVLLTRRGRALSFCFHPAGWLVFAALALPWYIAAYRAHPAMIDRWMLEHFGRFTRCGGTWGRSQPLLFYFYMAPLIMLPWTIWLAGGVVHGFKEKMWSNRNWRLIACFFIAGLIVLTASSWKAKHYILPVLPGLAIPTAWYLVRNTYEHIEKRRSPFLMSYFLLVIGAMGVGFVWNVRPAMVVAATVCIAGCVGLLTAAIHLDYHRRPRSTLAVLFATFWFAGVYFQGFLIQHFDSYRYQAELGRRINSRLDGTETVYIAGIDESQILFYLRWPARRMDTVEGFLKEIRQRPSDDYYVVTTAGAADAFRSGGQVDILDEVEKPRPRQTETEKLVFIRLRTLVGRE